MMGSFTNRTDGAGFTFVLLETLYDVMVSEAQNTVTTTLAYIEM